MPIYEFLCSGCNTDFEKILRNSDLEGLIECPACESSKKVKRKLSVFSSMATNSISEGSSNFSSYSSGHSCGGGCSCF